jgi:hypothetical protein
MFTEADIKQVEKRGSEIRTVENQIENFKKGFTLSEAPWSCHPKRWHYGAWLQGN